MKADFPALWAESPVTLRREPTNAELAGGFPCGDLDLQLFNELFFRLSEVQREIVYAIVQSGQTPNVNNTTQLWEAIKIAAALYGPPPVSLWHSGTAAGTASALTVATLTPPITAYVDMLPCLIAMPNFTNADGATLKIGSLAAVPIRRNDGTAIQQGDAPAGSDLLVDYRGGAFRVIGFARGEVQKIATNVTLYCRTDGDDDNDGLTNTASGAFRTINAAFRSAIRFSNTTTVTVQLGNAGTYAAPNALPKTGGSFKILGSAGNPGAYVISGAGVTNTPPITVGGASLELNGVSVNNTGTINNTLGSVLGGSISTTNVILTSVAGNLNSHASAFASGSLAIGDNTTFGSSMGGMISANGGSAVLGGNHKTANLPNWATGGLVTVGCGTISVVPGHSYTGSGATGRRYYVITNGVINTNFAGEIYVPGSVAGFKDSGGQYV